MTSQWFCKILDEEKGPLELQDLIDMARSGTLREDDLVLPPNSTIWIPSRYVAALAEMKRDQESTPHNSPVAELYDSYIMNVAQNEEFGAILTPNSRQRQLSIGVISLMIVIIVVGIDSFWLSHPQTMFPQLSRLSRQYPVGHFFFGTGPWSTMELALLWFDCALVIWGFTTLGYRWQRPI